MPSPFGRAALPITGCIAVLIAIILLILSFASPYWSEHELTHRGLWRFGGCNVAGGCWKYNFPHYVPSWLKAVQAMESLGIICLSLPLVIIPIYMYVTHGFYYKTICFIAAALSFAAAIFIIIGIIIYGVFAFGINEWDMRWCFVTCLISGLISIVATLIFLGAAIAKRPPKPSYYTSTVIMQPGTPATMYAVEKDNSGFDHVEFVN